jgi:hypothetical protein
MRDETVEFGEPRADLAGHRRDYGTDVDERLREPSERRKARQPS